MTNTNTRDQLLDAAQDLIQRFGLNAMSFQHLSDAVGIRKPSVHHHFANKSDMVQALLERYQEQYDASIAAILASRANGRPKLQRYCAIFVDTLNADDNDKGCVCGMLMAELLSLDEKSVGLVRQFLRSNANCLKTILATGAQDGSLQPQSKPDATADLILCTMEGGLLVARCEQGPKQLSDIAKRLVSLLSA